MSKKNKRNDNYLNGDTPAPARVFQLPHHHYLLNVPVLPHALRETYFKAILSDKPDALKLLRDPQGRPVARRHRDLKPGEISLVLG